MQINWAKKAIYWISQITTTLLMCVVASTWSFIPGDTEFLPGVFQNLLYVDYTQLGLDAFLSWCCWYSHSHDIEAARTARFFWTIVVVICLVIKTAFNFALCWALIDKIIEYGDYAFSAYNGYVALILLLSINMGFQIWYDQFNLGSIISNMRGKPRGYERIKTE